MFAVRYDMQNMPLCMQNTPAICANEVIGSSAGLVPINALVLTDRAKLRIVGNRSLTGLGKGCPVIQTQWTCDWIKRSKIARRRAAHRPVVCSAHCGYRAPSTLMFEEALS